jgi:hypothetical protein
VSTIAAAGFGIAAIGLEKGGILDEIATAFPGCAHAVVVVVVVVVVAAGVVVVAKDKKKTTTEIPPDGTRVYLAMTLDAGTSTYAVKRTLRGIDSSIVESIFLLSLSFSRLDN